MQKCIFSKYFILPRNYTSSEKRGRKEDETRARQEMIYFFQTWENIKPRWPLKYDILSSQCKQILGFLFLITSLGCIIRQQTISGECFCSPLYTLIIFKPSNIARPLNRDPRPGKFLQNQSDTRNTKQYGKVDQTVNWDLC